MKYFAVMVDVSVDLTGTKKNIFFEIAIKAFHLYPKNNNTWEEKIKTSSSPSNLEDEVSFWEGASNLASINDGFGPNVCFKGWGSLDSSDNS